MKSRRILRLLIRSWGRIERPIFFLPHSSPLNTSLAKHANFRR